MRLIIPLILALNAPTQAAQLSARQGMLGLWHLNEGAGTVSSDATLRYNGSGFGGAWVTGLWGKGIDISAANTFVSVAHNTAFNVTDVTVIAWGKIEGGGGSGNNDQNAIVVKNYSGAIPFYLGQLNAEGSGFHYLSGSWKSAILARDAGGCVFYASRWRWPKDRWIMYVGTYNSTTDRLRFYMNGVMEADVSSTTNLPTNTLAIGIGEADWANYYFDGKIDEVSIWNRALSPSEIKRLYTYGLGRRPNE